MNLPAIDQFLASSFFLSFITSYTLEQCKGGIMKYVKEKFQPDDIEYQFMEALNDAMRETCQAFFGEYDDTAVPDTFIASLANLEQVKSISSIREIFQSAIGQPVDNKVLDAWVENFNKEITKPRRDWLYRYVIFQSTIKKMTIELSKRHKFAIIDANYKRR